MPYDTRTYEVNWTRLLRILTPWELRKKGFVSFMAAALYPFIDLHARLLYSRQSIQYKLGINYQTCNLERLLNDNYDFENRGIFITNTPITFLPLLVSQQSEARPLKVAQPGEGEPLKVAQRTETAAGSVSFIINIPIGVFFEEIELRAQVAAYALPTKTFEIRIYE